MLIFTETKGLIFVTRLGLVRERMTLEVYVHGTISWRVWKVFVLFIPAF